MHGMISIKLIKKITSEQKGTLFRLSHKPNFLSIMKYCCFDNLHELCVFLKFNVKWNSYRNIYTTRMHTAMKLWMKMPAHFTTNPPPNIIKWKLHNFCCSSAHIMTTTNSRKYVYSNNVNISCPASARFLRVVRPLPLRALYKTDTRCVKTQSHGKLGPMHATWNAFRFSCPTIISHCNLKLASNITKKRCVVAVYVLRQKIKYWSYFPWENRVVYAKWTTEYAWSWGWFSSQRNFICY
jgi:hypothetical protein